MGRKLRSTGTIALASGDNTLIAAQGAGAESCIRRLWFERTDTAVDVTIIVKNNAASPRELLPRITLNADAGKVLLEFDDDTEVGSGDNLAVIVNASVGSKANVYAEYRTEVAKPWPA